MNLVKLSNRLKIATLLYTPIALALSYYYLHFILSLLALVLTGLSIDRLETLHRYREKRWLLIW